MTTTNEAIDRLAGRGYLGRDDLIRLGRARQEQAPVEDRSDRDGWTVSVMRHVHTGDHWSASAWRAGTSYDRETCLASAATEAECRAAVEAFLAPADLGSLDPIDVGFDLRATGHSVAVPGPKASVTVRLPRSKRHPEGEQVAGDSRAVLAALRDRGYTAHAA